MAVETIREFLLWCTVINVAILWTWFIMFRFAGDWICRMRGKSFNLSREQFDVIHYAIMGCYKIAVFVFNLVPYLALQIIA